ncbi:hypothetical protein GCM10010260_30570 [Streptomyces filipinensis]|uniref:Insertion element IS402-like domain-containing protein n=1 Tax=Streptomyces filipinensis TaxID=66887 RepID=A0A918IAG7_9ACTN|nr:hypothetical protein GCM10010260_30570 [Streptomyces filipinensis]
MPDGLWDIAKPLIPEQRTRAQGGGTANTPDDTLFAAIIYVLVSGCAWRALPPCFGVSKSTAHRRFLIWSRAGVWARLHEAVLHQLDDAGLIDVTRVILDTAHVRAKKGANTHPWWRVTKRDTTPIAAATSRRGGYTRTKRMTGSTCGDGYAASASESGSPAKASNPANDWVVVAGG